MKIEKIIKQSNKLLKLKLLKTKTYEKKHSLKDIIIEDTEHRLKKALHIIYKYHLNNKRILFVGSSFQIKDEIALLLKNTKHILIPETIWLNGIITNQSSSLKYLSKNKKSSNNKISEILFQLKKKSDLIVILNTLSNKNALKEGYTAKIPTVSLDNNLNIFDQQSSYKVPGTFKFTKKKVRNNFFCSILRATLKKANRIRLSKKNYNKPTQVKQKLKNLQKKYHN